MCILIFFRAQQLFKTSSWEGEEIIIIFLITYPFKVTSWLLGIAVVTPLPQRNYKGDKLFKFICNTSPNKHHNIKNAKHILCTDREMGIHGNSLSTTVMVHNIGPWWALVLNFLCPVVLFFRWLPLNFLPRTADPNINQESLHTILCYQPALLGVILYFCNLCLHTLHLALSKCQNECHAVCHQ